MAAGSFTATVLPKVAVKIDEIWADAIQKADYEAQCEAAKAIMMEQTAKLEVLRSSAKNITVRIDWIKDCGMTDEACSDDCTNDGAELESTSQDVTISTCRQVQFKVARKKMRDNNFDASEVAAKGLMKAGKVLDEYLAKQAVTFLNASVGVNEHTSAKWTLAGTPVGSRSEVAAANVNVGLIPHLILAGAKNRFSNPYLLSGTQLYVENWEKMLEAANADGKGSAAKMNAIRKHFDIFNVDTVNANTTDFYLVDKGAVALVTKAYYEGEVMDHGTKSYFSLKSNNLPGVVYDVIVDETCSSNEQYDAYTVQANFGYFLNPLGCTANRKGVLLYRQV